MTPALLMPTDLWKICAGGRAGYTAFSASKPRGQIKRNLWFIIFYKRMSFVPILQIWGIVSWSLNSQAWQCCGKRKDILKIQWYKLFPASVTHPFPREPGNWDECLCWSHLAWVSEAGIFPCVLIDFDSPWLSFNEPCPKAAASHPLGRRRGN